MLKNEKMNPIPKEERKTLYCKNCEQWLPLGDFGKDGKTSKGRQKYKSRCKKCNADHMRTNHNSNQQASRRLVDEIKTECSVCGYDKLKSALEFHHTDPSQKDDTISHMIWENADPEDVKREIKKCVVLCNRCHREVHAGLVKLVVDSEKEVR
jgi:hypothetical protein